jgi:ketopantoate reductase
VCRCLTQRLGTADIEARMLQTIRNFPPEMMPSMAVDLLRGNRLELPWLAGKMVALGRGSACRRRRST